MVLKVQKPKLKAAELVNTTSFSILTRLTFELLRLSDVSVVCSSWHREVKFDGNVCLSFLTKRSCWNKNLSEIEQRHTILLCVCYFYDLVWKNVLPKPKATWLPDIDKLKNHGRKWLSPFKSIRIIFTCHSVIAIVLKFEEVYFYKKLSDYSHYVRLLIS